MGRNDERYYDPTYLRSLKDTDGQLPTFYIVDGNRTAGKSVAFKKICMDSYLKEPSGVSQFMYLIRNKGDLAGIEHAFFDDISRLFYPDKTLVPQYVLNKNAVEFHLNDKKGDICGYAVALNMARKIKNFSGMFVRVKHIFFDEYQDEENNYLDNEIQKFASLITSVSRGDGEQVRRVIVFMASNAVSLLNPYYSYFGIDKRIKTNTKFLRGHGWVYERTWNESASQALSASGVARALKNSGYFESATQNVYLNDNMSLITKPQGQGKYFLSVKYNNKWFSIWRYPDIFYVAEGANMEFPQRVCFNVNDVTDDRQMMIGAGNPIVLFLREYFNRGLMRFQSLSAKEMTLDLLNYI